MDVHAPAAEPAATDFRHAAGLLAACLPGLSLEQRMREARSLVPGRLVLTTSFGLEDQALTHAAASEDLDIDLVTLDTGRLFPETYAVWAETERRYGIRVRAFVISSDAGVEMPSPFMYHSLPTRTYSLSTGGSPAFGSTTMAPYMPLAMCASTGFVPQWYMKTPGSLASKV